MKPRLVFGLALLISGLEITACSGKDQSDSGSGQDSSDSATNALFLMRNPVTCEDPVEGMSRFSEEGEARGLTHSLPTVESVVSQQVSGVGGALVAKDLDGDEDIDLLVGGLDFLPRIYENDGTGNFTSQLLDLRILGGNEAPLFAALAADIDGDRLPELIFVGGSRAHLLRNEGNLQFEVVTNLEAVVTTGAATYMTAVIGDIDGDLDLDLVLPSMEPDVPGELPSSDSENLSPAPDQVLLQEAGAFPSAIALYATEDGSRTQVAALTDRDFDGDLDLLTPNDLGPPTSFWRNDALDESGTLQMVEDAEAIFANLDMAAMGIDNADINGDGWLDYVISDIGPPRVLLSDGGGGYVDAGLSLGLEATYPGPIDPDPEHDLSTTIGWSLDLADYNNDGVLDVAQASGPDPGAASGGFYDWPDLIWRGNPDGSYEDVTEESGFGDTENHVGLVSVDVDGNGSLDILVAGPGAPVKFLRNACTAGHWLAVDLRGLSENSEAFGARVEVTTGENVQVREVLSLRDKGQTPSRLHFGLGEHERVESLVVYWPGGAVSSAEDFKANRLVWAIHPDLPEARD